MENSHNESGFALLFTLATIASWLGSGYMAWSITHPRSFGGILFFLFAWAICGYIVDFIIAAVLAFIMTLFK